MSHLKERKEKKCLNCGADLYGRYCHRCGQENLEPKETVWHLVSHFFNDITHFDGKFFSTVKLLIVRPGFLSREYFFGKRASYLNPIRMYVFTSAIFFLVFFALKSGQGVKINEAGGKSPFAKQGIHEWENQRAALEKRLEAPENVDDSQAMRDSLLDLQGLITAAKLSYGDTTTREFSDEEMALLLLESNMDSLRKNRLSDEIALKVDSSIRVRHRDIALWDQFKTAAAYDSEQLSLTAQQRDGWFMRLFNHKVIGIVSEYRLDKRNYLEHVKEGVLHSFPKILFFSLPLFALILKLLYVRRPQYYYTDHGIFAIHVYCATFIMLLILLLVNAGIDATGSGWLRVIEWIVNFAVWIYVIIYLYIAMRVFYGQGWFKTLVKYVIINVLWLTIIAILFLFFLAISAISI